MTDYSELVEQLRYCHEQRGCKGCKLAEAYDCTSDLTGDAAAAIEALQAEVKFYDALAAEWQKSAENKERLLGLYRAEQTKYFYSAMDDNGRIIATQCSCMNIPAFPDSSENPNS